MSDGVYLPVSRSIVDYADLPDPIESGEEAIVQLEEAVDLLQSVVNELKALSEVE